MRAAAGGVAPLLGRLEDALPSEAFVRRGDGLPEVAPGGAEETAEVIRLAVDSGVRVLPRGSGLGPTVPGVPAEEEVLLLSTRRMRRIEEHSPADLTLRVGAGATLDEVDEAVRPAGQWLPLDPPGGGDVTVGGAVAEGAAGPLRSSFGRLRDHLLGLELVTGEGEILPLGGRVVKNVAGFDLVRLAAGSRGAIGVITSVTARLFPVPESDRTLLWLRPSPSEGIELGRRIARSGLPVGALEWGTGPEGGGDDGGAVALRLLGSEAAAASLGRRAAGVAGEPHRVLEGPDSALFWNGRARAEGRGGLALRADGLPAAGSALVEALMPLAVVPGAALWLHLLDGGVRLSLPGPSLPEPEVARRVEARVSAAGGRLRLLRVPDGDGWSPRPSARGPDRNGSPAEARLRARLVSAFDPRGCLPGAWREGWA